MRTNVYIDASNLFYGGKKSLGWSIVLPPFCHTPTLSSELYAANSF